MADSMLQSSWNGAGSYRQELTSSVKDVLDDMGMSYIQENIGGKCGLHMHYCES